ncbi:NAD(P)/FAD-dependent oxidoreductase [Ruminococcus sp. HUN007]|uniref:NAD(P)/FAD-dependent oxidoreductase n=1 Tax=Ruminococcus sp. HUN007 TaxID=1514668 RepID=UPI0005D1679F|nr:NAD(P)/FAD-dependent oxidoreductase [Ruminococcus sp. HUN007]
MKNIVIIGAGPAGLTAAYELLSKANDQYSVTVLEGSSEIGGISRTVKHNGNRMDIGGHRFFSKDRDVTNWWENMMPTQGKPSFDDIKLGRVKKLKAGGPDPEETDRVMLVRNRVSRIYYRKKFFDYPISMKMQTIKNMGFASTVSAGCSYLGSCISKKPEDSLENFYINRFGKVLYSMFFEGYTEKLWGRHPRDISADWGAQRVKGLSIRAVLKDMFSKIGGGNKDRKVETSLIEEFIYPKYGPGQLWETVAEEVKKLGGEIRMNSEVVKINTADGKINSVELADGSTVDGDIFISSMPLKDLVGGMNDVPDDIAKIAAGLPYRDFVTVGLLVNKLNLKNETDIKTLGNIVPDCWIYVQDTGVKLGRIQIFNNWSPYMVKKPEETVWIGLEYFCNENDDFWNLSDEECIKMATRELASMGVINNAGEVLDSHRERVKKAYPAYFDTYSEIDTLVKYLDSFDNLYCVGRNGQHRYNNMDHSMVTAFETAKNIISGKTSKDNIWNVNTEKEYHEEKNS